MTCAYQDQLDDYVDHALAPPAASVFEAHLAGCESCETAVAQLRALHAAVGELEQRTVPTRVWANIESRLGEQRPFSPGRRWQLPAAWWAGWAPVAVALGMLAVALVLWTVLAPGAPAIDQPAGPSAIALPAADSVEGQLQLAAQHYETAIADLQQIAAAERDVLDPQTSEVLDSSLSVIDHAIDESRAALNDQPASDVARESLFEALRSKVALLQDTVALINEMRKGDQDGVARAISGFTQ